MSYLNIPAELREEKAWVNVWDGSKVPMQATVRKAASSSNPDTWSNYIDAEHNVQHGYYDGLGYVFHDTGVVGIDIDDGFTDGLLNPLAADIIGRCHSYTEKSRSGRGVHILVRGELPFKGKNNRAAVEIYKSNRYFIMTGEVLIFSEIVENQSAIDYVIEKYFPDTPKESSSVAMYYAGDYLTMLENNPDLKFVVPKEGSNWFVDAMCVLKTSQHKEEAEAWINFITSTSSSLANMDYIWYGSPNAEAMEEYPAYYEAEYEEPLDEEIYNIMAAPPEVLERCELYINLPQETLKFYNDLWTRLGI